MSTYCIKVRKRFGGKRWNFFSGKGTNHLRIHAVEFSSETAANEQLKELEELNGTDYEFKVEKFTRVEVRR